MSCVFFLSAFFQQEKKTVAPDQHLSNLRNRKDFGANCGKTPIIGPSNLSKAKLPQKKVVIYKLMLVSKNSVKPFRLLLFMGFK